MMRTVIRWIYKERLLLSMLCFIGAVPLSVRMSTRGRDVSVPPAMPDFHWIQQDFLGALGEHPFLMGMCILVVLLCLLGFLCGVILLIAYVICRVLGKNCFPCFCKHRDVPWGLWEVFRVIVAYVFLGHLISMCQLSLSIALGWDPSGCEKNRLTAFYTCVMDIGLILIVCYLVFWKFRLGWDALGLRRGHTVKAVFYGGVAYLGIAPVLLGLGIVSSLFWTSLGYEMKPHVIVPMLMEEQSFLTMAVFVALACLVAPICEEIFFRGFAYPALKQRLGRGWGMVTIALIFSLVHFNLQSFIPIFALGLWLVYLYERTGNLWVPITVHVVNNSVPMSILGVLKTMHVLMP